MINALCNRFALFLLPKFILTTGSLGLTQKATSGLSSSLFIYIVGFIIALIFLLLAIYKERNIDIKLKKLFVIMIFTIGLFIRLFISVIFVGHPIDISCFKAWASSAAQGLSTFYTKGNFVDYPPLYIYVLAYIEKVRLLLFRSSPDWVYTLLIKLPSIIGDVLCSYFLYKFTLKKQDFKTAIIVSFVYLFNPATIVVSCMWGQVDGLFMLLLILATILLYEKKYTQATVWYALSVLFKPQGLIFLPILFFIIVKEKNIKLLAKCFATGLITFIIPVLPFTGGQRPEWIIKLYFNTATSYKSASLNAYNLFSLLGANWKDDSEKLFIFSYGTWGMIFIVIVTLITAWYILTSKNLSTPASASAMLISGVYLLASKMHERYIFPVLLLLLLAYAISRNIKFLLLSSGFTITAFINILQVFILSQKEVYWVPADDSLLITFSFINLILMVFTFIVTMTCSNELNNDIPSKTSKIKSSYHHNNKKKGRRK